MDEEKLLSKAARGDTAAFEALIEPHMTKVYNIAYRICQNADDAADAAQDAFLKAFGNISKFKGGAKFSTWLYRIATNAALDMVKGRGRHGAYSLDAEISGEDGEVLREIPSDAPLPQEEAERAEVRREINAALARLSDPDRSIIVLRDINGMAYRELSEILGCSEGTVKSRLSRARQKLREILSKNRELFCD